MEEFQIRKANGDDLNFIYSTWLKSYEQDSCFGEMSSNLMFTNFYRQIIDQILSKPNTKVIVLTIPEEPMVILSYIVYEPEILHYIYTKAKFRKHGLAKKLFDYAFNPSMPCVVNFTHQTRMVRDIVTKYKDQLFYKDNLIFKGDSNGTSTQIQNPH
jgi:hypothetical protein